MTSKLFRTDENRNEIINAVTIWSEITAEAFEKGYLSGEKSLPHVPEIMMYAKQTCIKIYNEMIRTVSAGESLFTLLFGWSMYAGIGATAHWDYDWNALNKVGVFETLVTPRGFDCMDEYVTDFIGLKFGSKKSDDLIEQLHYLSALATLPLAMDDKVKAIEQTVECMCGMYLYGMTYQLKRMGMN